LLIIGVVGLASTYANDQNSYAYFGATVSLSYASGEHHLAELIRP
jgi:hypothetical protein